MRDSGNGGGISRLCLIFLRDTEARRCSWGTFCSRAENLNFARLPPGKQLSVPNAARLGAFAEAGLGGIRGIANGVTLNCPE